jgi:hypothetical protein
LRFCLVFGTRFASNYCELWLQRVENEKRAGSHYITQNLARDRKKHTSSGWVGEFITVELLRAWLLKHKDTENGTTWSFIHSVFN